MTSERPTERFRLTFCVQAFHVSHFQRLASDLDLNCVQWGDLFEYVIRILKRHKPRFLLIENVPNLLRHDDGRTWERLCNRLRDAGYSIEFTRLSPHMFGVPQIRERALIVGDRMGLSSFKWPKPTHAPEDITIKTALDVRPAQARVLTSASISYIKAWQALLDQLPANERLLPFRYGRWSSAQRIHIALLRLAAFRRSHLAHSREHSVNNCEVFGNRK